MRKKISKKTKTKAKAKAKVKRASKKVVRRKKTSRVKHAKYVIEIVTVDGRVGYLSGHNAYDDNIAKAIMFSDKKIGEIVLKSLANTKLPRSIRSIALKKK